LSQDNKRVCRFTESGGNLDTCNPTSELLESKYSGDSSEEMPLLSSDCKSDSYESDGEDEKDEIQMSVTTDVTEPVSGSITTEEQTPECVITDADQEKLDAAVLRCFKIIRDKGLPILSSKDDEDIPVQLKQDILKTTRPQATKRRAKKKNKNKKNSSVPVTSTVKPSPASTDKKTTKKLDFQKNV
jgi:hypothetical protein